jgi:hypothetical protein
MAWKGCTLGSIDICRKQRKKSKLDRKGLPHFQNDISFDFAKLLTFICLLIISSTSRNMASLFSQSQTHCSDPKENVTH